jgi:hypothetical protein
VIRVRNIGFGNDPGGDGWQIRGTSETGLRFCISINELLKETS